MLHQQISPSYPQWIVKSLVTIETATQGEDTPLEAHRLLTHLRVCMIMLDKGVDSFLLEIEEVQGVRVIVSTYSKDNMVDHIICAEDIEEEFDIKAYEMGLF